PGDRPYIIRSPRVNQVNFVTDLIDEHSGKCKESVVIVNDQEARRILSIPLVQYGLLDMLVNDDVCLRCGEVAETTSHACRDCPYVVQLFTRNTQNQVLIIITIWALWLSRNKLLHEGKRQSNSELCTFLMRYINELEILEDSYPRSVTKETKRWLPPKDRRVKVNFDRRCYSDLKASSSGIIIGDNKGLIMGTTCNWERNILFVEVTKALASGSCSGRLICPRDWVSKSRGWFTCWRRRASFGSDMFDGWRRGQRQFVRLWWLTIGICAEPHNSHDRNGNNTTTEDES
ncbi:hypothetical protein Goari_022633, partial [Gossypium aridum]|nr:hypothetical protein [Gossypium aridum]